MAAAAPDTLVERLAQYETLVEATAPPPADHRCTCDRCRYGPRYFSADTRRPAA